MGRTMYESVRAKMQNINMFSIGIGDRTNKRELNSIASDPASDFMFEVWRATRHWTLLKMHWLSGPAKVNIYICFVHLYSLCSNLHFRSSFLIPPYPSVSIYIVSFNVNRVDNILSDLWFWGNIFFFFNK